MCTIPESPTQFFSLCRSMLWSTVSNATLRSSSTSTDILPDLELRRISFIILIILRWRVSEKLWKRAANAKVDAKQPFKCKQQSHGCVCDMNQLVPSRLTLRYIISYVKNPSAYTRGANSALPGHFPSEFSSNPNQTHLNQVIIVFKTTRRLRAGEFFQGWSKSLQESGLEEPVCLSLAYTI